MSLDLITDSGVDVKIISLSLLSTYQKLCYVLNLIRFPGIFPNRNMMRFNLIGSDSSYSIRIRCYLSTKNNKCFIGPKYRGSQQG